MKRLNSYKLKQINEFISHEKKTFMIIWYSNFFADFLTTFWHCSQIFDIFNLFVFSSDFLHMTKYWNSNRIELLLGNAHTCHTSLIQILIKKS